VTVYGLGGVKDLNLEEKPPTPGLKYRHYSPNAFVILLEPADKADTIQGLSMGEELIARVRNSVAENQSIGIIHTHSEIMLPSDLSRLARYVKSGDQDHDCVATEEDNNGGLREGNQNTKQSLFVYPVALGIDRSDERGRELFAAEVARGLFQALRSLDSLGVDVILVEVISPHATLSWCSSPLSFPGH